MIEKTITLELNEQELNVVWATLQTGTILGQNAPHVVMVMQKIQSAVNEANTPQPEEPEVEIAPEEPAPEEPKAEGD